MCVVATEKEKHLFHTPVNKAAEQKKIFVGQSKPRLVYRTNIKKRKVELFS